MDSAAFDAIKSNALSLVHNKLETQREVQRMQDEVNQSSKNTRKLLQRIEDTYRCGEQAFLKWEHSFEKKTKMFDHALLVLSKADSEQKTAEGMTAESNLEDSKQDDDVGNSMKKMSVATIESHFQVSDAPGKHVVHGSLIFYFCESCCQTQVPFEGGKHVPQSIINEKEQQHMEKVGVLKDCIGQEGQVTEAILLLQKQIQSAQAAITQSKNSASQHRERAQAYTDTHKALTKEETDLAMKIAELTSQRQQLLQGSSSDVNSTLLLVAAAIDDAQLPQLL